MCERVASSGYENILVNSVHMSFPVVKVGLGKERAGVVSVTGVAVLLVELEFLPVYFPIFSVFFYKTTWVDYLSFVSGCLLDASVSGLSKMIDAR